jgi:hypothetical protein
MSSIKRRLFFRPNGLLEFDKELICYIIGCYLKHNDCINSIFSGITKDCVVNFDDLIKISPKNIENQQDEILMLDNALSDISLIVKGEYEKLVDKLLINYSYSTPQHLKKDWLTNHQMRLVGPLIDYSQWVDFDLSNNGTIISIPQRYPNDINEDVRFPDKKIIGLINPLIMFQVKHGFHPDNFTNSKFHNLYLNSNLSNVEVGDQTSPSLVCDGIFNEEVVESVESLSDEWYRRYPAIFLGCYPCDVFFQEWSYSLEEITLFLSRYPSCRIFIILNTITYRSGSSGEHWVSLMIFKKTVSLICSQGGSFNIFKDGGNLKNKFEDLGYTLVHNHTRIQTSNYECGSFSMLSTIKMLIYGNIEKAVKSIGVDGENLGKRKGYMINVKNVIENVIGVIDKVTDNSDKS